MNAVSPSIVSHYSSPSSNKKKRRKSKAEKPRTKGQNDKKDEGQSHQHQLLHEARIPLSPPAHFQKLILLARLLGILAPQPLEIVRRHGVNNLLVLCPADLTIDIQNSLVGPALPDPHQTIKQPPNIHKAARDTQPTKRITQVRSISREDEPTLAERFGEPLVHLVGREVDDVVVGGFGVAREDGFEFPGLAGQELGVRQAGLFVVGDAPEARRVDYGGHVEVLGVDYEVCVFVAEFAEVVVCLAEGVSEGKECLIGSLKQGDSFFRRRWVGGDAEE